MYFDDDDDYFYFGIVTSNPYEHNWAKEDLAIDLDGDDFPEYGLDVANLEGDQLEMRGVYSVEDWRELRDVPYRIDEGDQIGQYQIYQKYLGDIEPDLGQPGGYYGHTYFLEMKVNRALFGNIPCGTPINILFSRVTCLKDWFMVNGCTNGNCPPGVIPEPATLFLLGAGLFGIAGSRRRKK
ncbi:MAG: PEP-CTERM sorting domain-containing protein [Candidatus Omnitrophica bacterium]|nr:PEP-CTERM sorting domain-containing protein [Candidatus Omnitrophota bacterium]